MEVSLPTANNDLLDVIYRIPPERRLDHRIHRQVIIRLSPGLAGIAHNKIMMPARAPLFLWRFGKAYRLYARQN